MAEHRLIRDYENSSLPLEKRLPSLARRLSCLAKARGLDPWDPVRLRQWLASQDQGSAAWHAGHFILGLWEGGKDAPFDAIEAVRCWSDEDRKIFANWVLSWRD